MKQLDEALHVFDSHTGNKLFLIEGEEREYSKDELVGVISEAREELLSFQEAWLKPIIEELRMKRDEVEKMREGYERLIDAIDSEMGDGDLAREIARQMVTPNAKVRGDAPLYGAASLSTDGLCSGGEK